MYYRIIPPIMRWEACMFCVGLDPLKQRTERTSDRKDVRSNGNKWAFILKQVVTLFSSCGSQRPEVADIWHVPSLRRNHHDWAPSKWQEEEVHNKVKEQQLGSQIQWNFSLVSVKNSLRIWSGKFRCRGRLVFSSVHKQTAQDPKEHLNQQLGPVFGVLAGKARWWEFLLWVGCDICSLQAVFWPLSEKRCALSAYLTMLHYFNELYICCW